jgi:hypothetical protein
VELLVVIVIIAILIALIVPAVQKVRQASARTTCANNLRQIALGFHGYHDTFKNFPPGRIDEDGGATWAVLIMPFIEQEAVYKLWNLKKGYYEQPQEAVQAQVPIYYCPARRTAADNPLGGPEIPEGGYSAPNIPGALGDYAVCDGDDANGDFNTQTANGAIITAEYTNSGSGPFIITHWRSLTNIASITDGASNTFLVGEKHVKLGTFGQNSASGGYGDGSIYNGDPENQYAARIAGPSFPLALSPTTSYNTQFGSWHQDICQFAFCDGSVKVINNSIDLVNYQRLSVRNDGHPITINLE